jgi:hypothetical protein
LKAVAVLGEAIRIKIQATAANAVAMEEAQAMAAAMITEADTVETEEAEEATKAVAGTNRKEAMITEGRTMITINRPVAAVVGETISPNQKPGPLSSTTSRNQRYLRMTAKSFSSA